MVRVYNTNNSIRRDSGIKLSVVFQKRVQEVLKFSQIFHQKVSLVFQEMGEIIKSSRGKPVLNLEGYSYHRYEQNLSGEIMWRCVKRCGGWASQDENKFSTSKDHNHLPSPTSTKVRSLKFNLKERAKSHPHEKPINTLAEVKKTSSEFALPHLPLESSLKSDISRWKRDDNVVVNGNTRESLKIPPELQKSAKGDNFLIYDSADQDRILIFSTQKNLSELSLCSVWLMDGTFDVAPKMFEQVYTLHGLNNGWILPLVFALLPNKKRNTYEKFLNGIISATRGCVLSPELIIMDYEAAAISAASTVFETAIIQGCFFHLSQALNRNLPQIIKQQIRQGDKELELTVKKFATLAFVPPTHVELGFGELQREILHKYKEMAPFIKYFRENFIGTIALGPRFHINILNVYHRTNACLPRTNNSVEWWNNRLANKINKSHPSVARLIEVFKEEQSWVEACFQNRLVGGEPPTQVMKYAELNYRLVNLVRDFRNREILDYIEGIAYNLLDIRKFKKRKRHAEL